MKKFLKGNWKFILFVLFGGLIGGYCMGFYAYDTLSEDLLKHLQEQSVTREMIGLSTMFQYGILFGVVPACFGLALSKKVKLWNKFKIDKKAILAMLAITIIGTLLLYPGDKLIFGSLNSWVDDQYTVKPTIYKIIGGLLVGGIIEEVLMRLFFMSLLVLIISKLFYKNSKNISVIVYVIANAISAFLFAASHLPSTAAMTVLTPVLIIRCFLFNGSLGLAFGYLYRKFGIGYAMLSHGFSHLISDILMIIFI